MKPIKDLDKCWVKCEWYDKKHEELYQHKDLPTLFKRIRPDGFPEYRDYGICYCTYLNNRKYRWVDTLIFDIVEEFCPIVMPYIPIKPIEIVCYERCGFLYVLFGVKSDGTKIDIYRYFEETKNGWKEINKEEHNYEFGTRKQ